MNRTIKFRRETNRQRPRVYGFLAEDYYINDVNSQDFPSIEIAPETVGQFTGLFAADGHEIYENDLVECSRHTMRNSLQRIHRFICIIGGIVSMLRK